MHSPYRYALRACIAPGFFVQEKLATLLTFCQEGRIEEVILFANYEDLNRGHVTPEEQAEWLEVYRQAEETLSPAGISLSLNPWETILHADRGRVRRPGQNFRLMVDPHGNQATACVCPLGEEWRAHLAATYARYAAVKPRVLWLEDDFRYHNHAPMLWGGCFCEEHLRIISERYGALVSREELVTALTAPGKPHPLRRLWLDLNGETTVELARHITQAVKAVSPETQMGLMTSVPATHCAEGRRWHELVEALGGGEKAVIRPHLPAYRESPPGQYLWRFSLSRQTAALLPQGTTVLPELDNGPHSLFTKSRAFTAFMIASSPILGASGITMNILDPQGNGPVLSEGLQTMLGGLRPFLDQVVGLEVRPEQLVGIRVPFSPRSSYTLRVDSQARVDFGRYDLNNRVEGKIEWLYPDEAKWAGLLMCYGFSTEVTTAREFSGETVAISGQWLRNLSTEEITRLFTENAILLDGSAAVTLCELGLGHLAGIAALKEIVPPETGAVSYEEIVDGTVLLGNARARFSAQGYAGPAALFDYQTSASVVSELRDFNSCTTGPGIVFGTPRCLVLPYLFPDGPETCLLSVLRKHLLISLLTRLACKPAQISYCPEQAYLTVFRYERPSGTVLLFANASTDEVERPTLHLGGQPDGEVEVEMCDQAGVVSRVTLFFSEEEAVLPATIPPMNMVALSLQG